MTRRGQIDITSEWLVNAGNEFIPDDFELSGVAFDPITNSITLSGYSASYPVVSEGGVSPISVAKAIVEKPRQLERAIERVDEWINHANGYIYKFEQSPEIFDRWKALRWRSRLEALEQVKEELQREEKE